MRHFYPVKTDVITVSFRLEICTGAVMGTNPQEREQILRKTRGNNSNGNDFCGNTAGTGPNFMGNTAGIRNNLL